MGRQTVRAAIVDYLGLPPIEGLGALYPSKPTRIAPNAYYQRGLAWGAIAYPYIERQIERRIAMGGEHGGQKWRSYDVGLQVMFRAKARASAEAEDSHDQLIDAIVERIQSDRTFGTDGDPIFQAGEGDGFGSNDIEVLSDLLAHQSDHSSIWSVVRFQVAEILHT